MCCSCANLLPAMHMNSTTARNKTHPLPPTDESVALSNAKRSFTHSKPRSTRPSLDSP